MDKICPARLLIRTIEKEPVGTVCLGKKCAWYVNGTCAFAKIAELADLLLQAEVDMQ